MNKQPLDEGLEVRIPSSPFYWPPLHSLATLACAFSVSSPPCPMNQDFSSQSAFPVLTVSSSTLEMCWWCRGSATTAKQDCSTSDTPVKAQVTCSTSLPPGLCTRRFQNHFTTGDEVSQCQQYHFRYVSPFFRIQIWFWNGLCGAHVSTRTETLFGNYSGQ